MEKPTSHLTEMPVPVADSTAEGVVPFAVDVAGHGSSVHVGRVQLLFGLHVAVSIVE